MTYPDSGITADTLMSIPEWAFMYLTSKGQARLASAYQWGYLISHSSSDRQVIYHWWNVCRIERRPVLTFHPRVTRLNVTFDLDWCRNQRAGDAIDRAVQLLHPLMRRSSTLSYGNSSLYASGLPGNAYPEAQRIYLALLGEVIAMQPGLADNLVTRLEGIPDGHTPTAG
jgi:hypothetical protein